MSRRSQRNPPLSPPPSSPSPPSRTGGLSQLPLLPLPPLLPLLPLLPLPPLLPLLPPSHPPFPASPSPPSLPPSTGCAMPHQTSTASLAAGDETLGIDASSPTSPTSPLHVSLDATQAAVDECIDLAGLAVGCFDNLVSPLLFHRPSSHSLTLSLSLSLLLSSLPLFLSPSLPLSLSLSLSLSPSLSLSLFLSPCFSPRFLRANICCKFANSTFSFLLSLNSPRSRFPGSGVSSTASATPARTSR